MVDFKINIQNLHKESQKDYFTYNISPDFSHKKIFYGKTKRLNDNAVPLPYFCFKKSVCFKALKLSLLTFPTLMYLRSKSVCLSSFQFNFFPGRERDIGQRKVEQNRK